MSERLFWCDRAASAAGANSLLHELAAMTPVFALSHFAYSPL